MKGWKRIYVYVTNEEREIIRKMAIEESYHSISSFMRDLALNKNPMIKEKFFEMYNKVMEK